MDAPAAGRLRILQHQGGLIQHQGRLRNDPKTAEKCSIAGCKVDEAVIMALLAHLPRQQAAGWLTPGQEGACACGRSNAASCLARCKDHHSSAAAALPLRLAAGQHGLGMDEARLAIAALQCLQRLSGATVLASGRSGSAAVGMSQVGWFAVGWGTGSRLCKRLKPHRACGLVAAPWQAKPQGLPSLNIAPFPATPQPPQIIGAAGGAGRIFAALMSGHDHVAAEAARLLLRFFAPAAARAGMGPWAGEAGVGSAAVPLGEPNEEEAAAAHAAKSVCFISQTRQAGCEGHCWWIHVGHSSCNGVAATSRHAAPVLSASTRLYPCLHHRCAALVRVLRQSRGAPLLSMAVAEAMAAVVCEPGSRTTDQATLEALLQASMRHCSVTCFT